MIAAPTTNVDAGNMIIRTVHGDEMVLSPELLERWVQCRKAAQLQKASK